MDSVTFTTSTTLCAHITSHARSHGTAQHGTRKQTGLYVLARAWMVTRCTAETSEASVKTPCCRPSRPACVRVCVRPCVRMGTHVCVRVRLRKRISVHSFVRAGIQACRRRRRSRKSQRTDGRTYGRREKARVPLCVRTYVFDEPLCVASEHPAGDGLEHGLHGLLGGEHAEHRVHDRGQHLAEAVEATLR